MGLKEVGRTGVQVNLSADGVTGVVTQDPESMLHSPGGLMNADGNTAFGLPFTVVGYWTATADDDQTITICDSDAPFKFRVLKGEAVLLSGSNGVVQSPNGRLSLSVLSGTSVVYADQLKDMETDELRRLTGNSTGADEIAADGSLSMRLVSRVPPTNETNTLRLVVTLTCLRVI